MAVQPYAILDVDPLASYERGVATRRANELAMQQEQQRLALNELYKTAVDPATGQLDVNKLYSGLATRGMGAAIPAMQVQQAEIAQKTAQARKAESEVRPAEWKQFRDEAAAIAEGNQAGYQAWANRVLTRAPWAIDFLPSVWNADTKRQMLMTADAALPKGEVRDIGGGTATIDPYTGKQIGATVMNVPLSADVEAQRARIAKEGATRIGVQAFTPAGETIQAESMKELRDTYKQLKTAPVDIANLREAARLATTSARKYMGTGGKAFLEGAKFLKNRLGVDVDTNAIVNAEAARTALFQNVLNNLRKLDAQPSQEQQRIMQEALGNLDTDPDALPSVVRIYEDVIRGRVELHNKTVEETERSGIKSPYSLKIELPEALQSTQKPQLSPEDKAALDWANSNPRDPRAAQIKQRLGVR